MAPVGGAPAAALAAAQAKELAARLGRSERRVLPMPPGATSLEPHFRAGRKPRGRSFEPLGADFTIKSVDFSMTSVVFSVKMVDFS